MLDWTAISTYRTDIIAVGALAVSLLSYRASQRSNALNRPYPSKTCYESREVFKLAGPNAEHWQVDWIRMVWPPRARFLIGVSTYDNGGSLISEDFPSSTRVLRPPSLRMVPSFDVSCSWALVRFSSRHLASAFNIRLIRIVSQLT